jgi:hypothetical protein
MPMIESRIAKLEQMTRDQGGELRIPGVTDDEMNEIRRVAGTCNTADGLIAYLRTRLPADEQAVVSLEDRRRADAVLAAAARTLFEEEHQ